MLFVVNNVPPHHISRRAGAMASLPTKISSVVIVSQGEGERKPSVVVDPNQNAGRVLKYRASFHEFLSSRICTGPGEESPRHTIEQQSLTQVTLLAVEAHRT